MRTKLKITTSLFLFISLFIFSQTEDFCATPEKTDTDPIGVYSKSTDITTLAAFNTKTFNIFF